MNVKRLALALAAITSFSVGAIDQYVWPGSTETPADIASLLLFAFLIFYWFREDAREHNYRRNAGLNIAVVGLAAVGMPYYLFRSRGGKRGAIAVACFFAAVVLSFFLTLAGQYAVYYGLQSWQ